MPNELDPAIAAFERRREEALAQVGEYERTINTLCKEAGYAPRYSETSATNSAKVTHISDDTFYGMKQTPAMRAYLEMRKAQGVGPAGTREIYDALVQGGYQFDAKTADIAMVGMRALLRTQPGVFHRLPQGTWGLSVWYPDAKKPKDEKPKKKKAAARKTAAKKLRILPPPKQRERSHEPGESQGSDE